MNFRVAALSALAVVLTGCATVSTDVAFHGTEGTSFALLTADNLVGANSYVYVFKKVDRANSTFQADWFRIRIGSDSGNLFKKPETLNTTATFAGESVPPGDYALVSRTEFSYYGLSSGEGSGCFALGAPVFKIRKGQIQVISLRRGVDPQQVQAQAEAILAAYPNMTAPVFLATVVDNVSFEVDDPNKCNPTGAFKLVEG